ncbi:hypothetical protein niasHS_007074 [Heterodera schachtii]|uniref:RING-type domain-containing protein n=1 Tax=Heterodera schachtii TaxID=97005 RepID=A0ABD2JFJ4_HETSC
MEKNRTIQNGKTAQNLAMHIIPLNEEVAISDPFAYFAVQKVYSLAKNVPLDSLCNFDDNGNNRKCILNYFETSADKKDAIVSIFDHWSNPLVPLLSKKENFFLFAILQELLNELKQRINNGHKVEGDCEAMLDTFWHYFDGENHPLFDLVKLRLVDEQIVSLIGELCQICQKLHLSSQSLDGQFKKWATVREKMLRFSEPKLALDSFCHWIMPNGAEDQGSADGISKSGEMSEEMRQIVKFWMAILSAKMFSHCSNWTENELIMLRDIGEMIQIVVIGAGNRSKEKIDNLMKAVQSEPEFETICAKLSDFMEDCQPEHRLMLSPWHKIVQKFPGNQNEFGNLFDVQPFERKASSEASESSEASASNCAAKNSKRKVSPKQKEQKGTKGHWSGICSFCHKAEVVSCFVGCRHFVCENCLLNFLDDNCPKCAQKTGNNNNTKSRFLPPKCFQSSAP